MSGVRRHSIFGDYILTDKKQSPTNMSNNTLTELRDYNTLWVRYARDVAIKWGGIPTEKGFAEWLDQIIKDNK